MYKEKKIINVNLLRSFCVEHGFCTDETNKDYEKVFMCVEFFNNEMSDNHSAYVKFLAWIAANIRDHIEDNFIYTVEYLMFLINKECVNTNYCHESK